MSSKDDVQRVSNRETCACIWEWEEDTFGTHVLTTWKYHEAREAEIERLREALREIRAGAFEYPNEWADIARRALGVSDEYLVQRLRQEADDIEMEPAECLWWEAADEIERRARK